MERSQDVRVLEWGERYDCPPSHAWLIVERSEDRRDCARVPQGPERSYCSLAAKCAPVPRRDCRYHAEGVIGEHVCTLTNLAKRPGGCLADEFVRIFQKVDDHRTDVLDFR